MFSCLSYTGIHICVFMLVIYRYPYMCFTCWSYTGIHICVFMLVIYRYPYMCFTCWSYTGIHICVLHAGHIQVSIYVFSCIISTDTRIGELRTQKLKSHRLRTQSLKVLPLKPRVGQHITVHATLWPLLPWIPFTCTFSPLPSLSCVSCS